MGVAHKKYMPQPHTWGYYQQAQYLAGVLWWRDVNIHGGILWFFRKDALCALLLLI